MPRKRRRLLRQRKELVDRYVRIAVHCKVKRIAHALARRISRPRLQWSERKREKALVAALQTTATEAARMRRLGFEAATALLNIGLFFLIAERDIQSVKIDALTHSDPWKRGLAARVMLLTIHELDIDKVAGKSLRQALDDGQVPQELRDSVTDAMRAIRKAQSRAQRQFTHLRNSTIAHRDPDAIRQYRDIVAIDGLEVTKIATEFYAGTSQFIDVLPRVIIHLSTVPGMINQLAAQQARAEST
ncbi:hypothetical protein [Burkholderia ubonensis]|uniref:hypothetical protein n=1 Tax=Burkholderia ubonensis TaxID=101571 RepID=UPI000ACE2A0A|nr:hypothetical protein [Burkholderia ubonensis]